MLKGIKICSFDLKNLRGKIRAVDLFDAGAGPSCRYPTDDSIPKKWSLYSGAPPPNTTQRIIFDEFGCRIYGWPSKGGVIIRKNADLVELEQLGFDHLDPPSMRSDDQEKEDAFCEDLRKIGGKWWRSEKRCLDVHFLDWDDKEPTAEELRVVWFGWPREGGLLVIQFEQDERPEDIGRLRMAATMEQRCKLMTERFSAKFYSDPALYDGLANMSPKRVIKHR